MARAGDLHGRVAGVPDGLAQRRGVGLAGFDVHAVCRQIESDDRRGILGLQCLADRVDAVATGHVVHLEGDHQVLTRQVVQEEWHSEPSQRCKVKPPAAKTLRAMQYCNVGFDLPIVGVMKIGVP